MAAAPRRSRQPTRADRRRGARRGGRAPGLSASLCTLRLTEVEDDALADDGVEGALGDAGRQRVADDVPDEDAVVAADERATKPGVLPDADRTLEPPVRRVQAVRVMSRVVLETGVDEPRCEL